MFGGLLVRKENSDLCSSGSALRSGLASPAYPPKVHAAIMKAVSTATPGIRVISEKAVANIESGPKLTTEVLSTNQKEAAVESNRDAPTKRPNLAAAALAVAVLGAWLMCSTCCSVVEVSKSLGFSLTLIGCLSVGSDISNCVQSLAPCKRLSNMGLYNCKDSRLCSVVRGSDRYGAHTVGWTQVL